ncbi:hypothetical protein RB195_005996 [Necator americanus]|uniref:Uncharacterized protein n=1 Tax=Necator americanus TaxID=51031 RepID=A0ABR1BUA7_NECAM
MQQKTYISVTTQYSSKIALFDKKSNKMRRKSGCERSHGYEQPIRKKSTSTDTVVRLIRGSIGSISRRRLLRSRGWIEWCPRRSGSNYLLLNGIKHRR